MGVKDQGSISRTFLEQFALVWCFSPSQFQWFFGVESLICNICTHIGQLWEFGNSGRHYSWPFVFGLEVFFLSCRMSESYFWHATTENIFLVPSFMRLFLWTFNYRTRVRSLAILVSNWLTDGRPFSKLDWCDSGTCRRQLKMCQSCTVVVVDDKNCVNNSLEQTGTVKLVIKLSFVQIWGQVLKVWS